MKCFTCGGIDYTRTSNTKCPYHIKSKAEARQKFTDFDYQEKFEHHLQGC